MANGVVAKIDEKRKKLIIEIDAELENLRTSPSGKTLRVASTEGNLETDAVVQGKKVVIGLNAWIKKS